MPVAGTLRSCHGSSPTLRRNVAEHCAPSPGQPLPQADRIVGITRAIHDHTMIPASHADLLTRPLAAVLSTLQPDGRPQASVVWFDATDAGVRINSERGRAKVRNVERDPRVTIVIVDPSDQHRYIEIRGDVVSIAEAGALEHRAALDRRYLGPDHRTDPTVDKGPRVVITIASVQVHAYG